MFGNSDINVRGDRDQSPPTSGPKSQGDEPRVLEYQVRLTEKRAPAEVLGALRDLLDDRGLRGRYLIEDGWRMSGALVSIFVNSSRVVEILKRQDELVQDTSELGLRVPSVRSQTSKVIHCATNQHWEAVNELFNIRLRFESNNLAAIRDRITDVSMSGSGRDQRLAIVQEANAARKEAIQNIQRALCDDGLERKFTVPHSEWYGTNNALTIVGTATVRTRLELKPNVTVERPLRTARGW